VKNAFLFETASFTHNSKVVSRRTFPPPPELFRPLSLVDLLEFILDTKLPYLLKTVQRKYEVPS
jgi:hypothetical protein